MDEGPSWAKAGPVEVRHWEIGEGSLALASNKERTYCPAMF
jgi:hypothetical protein